MKWTVTDAGPIQAKRVEKALSAVSWEANTFVELRGIVGQPETERRTTLTSFGIGRASSDARKDVYEALEGIGEKFEWTISKANQKAIIEAADAALAEAQANRPIRDQRETQEHRSEIDEMMQKRYAAEEAARQVKQALTDEAKAQMPSGAAAVILAILKEDRSDLMSDYSNNHAVRTVAIGWRFGAREDFKQLRAAAANFPETAHLGPDASSEIEHRDNHSMGAGNYLSDHGWDGAGSGWVIKSRTVDRSGYWDLTEVALPDAAQFAQVTEVGDVTVRPSSIGKPGVIEIVFGSKPDPSVLADLKAHGFRWAKSNRCWYGRNLAHAEELVGIEKMREGLAEMAERLS